MYVEALGILWISGLEMERFVKGENEENCSRSLLETEVIVTGCFVWSAMRADVYVGSDSAWGYSDLKRSFHSC